MQAVADGTDVWRAVSEGIVSTISAKRAVDTHLYQPSASLALTHDG